MGTYRQNLIISADDFGKNEISNENIFQLCAERKLDRVAVFANRDITSEEAAKLLSFSLKIDIHLDFPRTDREKQKDAEKKRENFWITSLSILSKIISGKIKASALEKEWENQIEEFRKIFGRYPDGINSHQHIHFFPGCFMAALRLSKKFGIPYVRFGKNGLPQVGNGVRRSLSFFHKKNISAFVSSRMDSSDYLISLDWIKNIKFFLAHPPEEKTEIICHPERSDEFSLMREYF